jgi:large subunit ribosomal protein L23
MDLSIYAVIKGPRITSKAYRLNQQLRQLVLEVHPQANKPMIAEALRKLFNVEPEKIRIVVSKGKNRRVGRHQVKGILKKKAFVTLKAGHSVDLMGWTNPEGIVAEQATPAT